MHITPTSKVVSKAKGATKQQENPYALEVVDLRNYQNASLIKNVVCSSIDNAMCITTKAQREKKKLDQGLMRQTQIVVLTNCVAQFAKIQGDAKL